MNHSNILQLGCEPIIRRVLLRIQCIKSKSQARTMQSAVSNRVYGIIHLTVSPLTIVAIVRTNERPNGRQSLIQFSKMSSSQPDKCFLIQFPALKVTISQYDKYAAETLLGAEMRSILYENAIFFTRYTSYCLHGINYVNFRSYKILHTSSSYPLV